MKTLGFCLVGIILCFIGKTEALKGKPGVCPDVSYKKIGVCAELCSNDYGCPGNQKCCSNGCGHTCTAPVKVKPGVCPPLGIGVCLQECSKDQDCPGNKKCCSTGCGRLCSPPYEA